MRTLTFPGRLRLPSYALLLFSGVCVPILLLGLYVWPSDDDFYNFNSLRSMSPVGYAVFMYQNWTGRFMTTLEWGIAFLQPELYRVLVFVPIVAFVLLPLALLAILRSYGIQIVGQTRWLIGAYVLATTFIVLLPYLGDCVFWLTGGLTYVVPFVASLWWLHAMTRPSWFTRLGPAVLIVLTIPISLFNEQMSAALIAATGVTALLRRKVSPLYAVCFVLLIVGSVILVSAPGNFARASLGPRGIALSPLTLLVNYALVLAQTWERFVGPALGGMGVGLTTALLFPAAVVDRQHVAMWTAVMAAAAFAAILPLAAVPDFTPPRTAFVPGVFLLAATSGVGFLAFRALTWGRLTLTRPVGAALATCLVAVYIGMATLDWSQLQDLQPQLAARWDTLTRAAGSNMDLELPQLPGTHTLAVYVIDISPDASKPENATIARYFGLKSIRTVRY